jgi:hypothetical protein
MKINFETLGYLTTREMWELMRDLGIPYCTIEDVEKENLSTKEKVMVPKFIPRTDFEDMKSDIVVAINFLNREQKRKLLKRYDKIIENRMKQSKVMGNG